MSEDKPVAGPINGVLTDAYAAVAESGDLKHVRINRRKPLDNDVVIRILYCGICHTDIHIAKNEWKNACYPVIPGHEITGVVEGLGKHVQKFKIGDKCGVGFYVDTCMECRQCKDMGMEQYCEKGIVIAFNSEDKRNETDGCRTCGGYSKTIVVNERFVFKWPDGLSMETGAPLLCAGITVYSPLKHLFKTTSIDGSQFRVAVIGLGGLGHIAVPLARSMGAHVTTIGREASGPLKRKLALDLGSHEHVSIESLSCGKQENHCAVEPFDVILDTISVNHGLDTFLSLLKLQGTLVTIGLPGEPMSFQARSVLCNRRSVMGSVVGSLAETQEMLEFCAKHNISCMTETIRMDQANEAYDRILKGDVKFRFVIDIANSTWP